MVSPCGTGGSSEGSLQAARAVPTDRGIRVSLARRDVAIVDAGRHADRGADALLTVGSNLSRISTPQRQADDALDEVALGLGVPFAFLIVGAD